MLFIEKIWTQFTEPFLIILPICVISRCSLGFLRSIKANMDCINFSAHYLLWPFAYKKALTVSELSDYRGSSLSTIFGILKKSYYAKFVLVSTT